MPDVFVPCVKLKNSSVPATLSSKCKRSGKSERNETEDNIFLSGKISLLNECGSEFFIPKRVEYCYQNNRFHSFQSGFPLWTSCPLFNSLNEWKIHLLTFEELISKTSCIHSYILLICRSGHSKEANFQHKIWLQMENVGTNWNLEKKISKNSNSTIVRTAFWPCHIWTCIKKNKGIKFCLVPKPLLSTPACHLFLLLITL